MKVTIEGKEFVIDIEKAKELGVLKEQRPTITKFEVGDVYKLDNGNRIVIIEAGYGFDNMRFSITGLRNNLHNYSTFGQHGGTKAEVLEHLNSLQTRCGAVFVKNINDDFKKLLKSL